MASRSEMPTDPFQSFMNAEASEAWRKSMFLRFERFWETQTKLLDEYQAFTRAMLDRRRAATDATLDAVRKMSSATDGADWAKCCADWLSGSMARIAEDGRDFFQEGLKVMSEMSQTVTAEMDEAARSAGEAQRTGLREAAAVQGAAADQGAAMAQEAARAAKVPPRPRRPEEGMRPGAAD